MKVKLFISALIAALLVMGPVAHAATHDIIPDGRMNSSSAMGAVTPLQQWKLHRHTANHKNLQPTVSLPLALYYQLTSITIHQGLRQLNKSNPRSTDLFNF